MADVFNTAIQCDTPLQILGLIIISIVFITFGILIYKTIRFIGCVILKFHKVDVTVEKDGSKIETHLS